MAKPRELTEAEKFYVQNNITKSNSELCVDMSGIGEKSIKKYKEELKNNPDSEKTNIDHITETREERIDRLGNSGKAGEFLSRRDGVAIMTQQASEVTDARKIVRGQIPDREELEGRNIDKIHRPKG